MKATDREAQLRLEESDITLSDILTKLVKMPEFLSRCLPIKDRTWRIDHDVNRRKVTEEKLKKAVDTTVMIDTIEYLNDYTQTYVSPLQEQYTNYDKKVKSSYQATNIYDNNGMAIGTDLDTYHQDGLKSNITQISKENGRLYSSNLYQEFGKSERRINDQAGYRSQYHDNSADIHLRAREYNTTTGRFLQQDTVLGSLKNPTTQNKYIYGNNNPFMYRDDAGRFGWNDVWNGIKKAAKKAVQIVDKYVVKPVVKAAKAVGNFVKDLFTSNSGSGNSGYTNYDTYSTTGAPTIYYDSNGHQIVSNQIEPNISPYARQEIERIQAERIAKEKAIRQDRIRKMCEGAGKLLDQVVKGSYSKNSSKGGTLLEIILGGVPGIGDIGDIRDAAHGVQTGNWLEVIASGLGVIPFAGGAVKEGVQSLAKEGAQSAAKETAQNSAKETAQQVAKKVEWPTNDSQLDHIFRKAEGHFDVDTPTNRKLIEDSIKPEYANPYPNDPTGKSTIYKRILSDGREVWVQIREEKIQDGGVNLGGRK
ncbi:RHS repeat-associated core domain-containing protein [Pseudolactococcus yaeyamensis]